jgi:hypothetical protein
MAFFGCHLYVFLGLWVCPFVVALGVFMHKKLKTCFVLFCFFVLFLGLGWVGLDCI